MTICREILRTAIYAPSEMGATRIVLWKKRKPILEHFKIFNCWRSSFYLKRRRSGLPNFVVSVSQLFSLFLPPFQEDSGNTNVFSNCLFKRHHKPLISFRAWPPLALSAWKVIKPRKTQSGCIDQMLVFISILPRSSGFQGCPVDSRCSGWGKRISRCKKKKWFSVPIARIPEPVRIVKTGIVEEVRRGNQALQGRPDKKPNCLFIVRLH